MQKVIIFCIILWAGCAPRSSVSKETTAWMKPAEIEAALKKEPRPVLVDIYTSWCGWCKVMDKNTYSHPEVVQYLAEHFYPMKMDAESRNPISWKGKEYGLNANTKTNELAMEWMNGNLSYPTTAVVLPDGTAHRIPGYLTPAEFEPIIKYFGEGAWRKMPFPEFQKQFHATWK